MMGVLEIIVMVTVQSIFYLKILQNKKELFEIKKLKF